ncbi:hypothetical protein Hanom_Chr07g00642631 [Helianthus anomalus]
MIWLVSVLGNYCWWQICLDVYVLGDILVGAGRNPNLGFASVFGLLSEQTSVLVSETLKGSGQTNRKCYSGYLLYQTQWFLKTTDLVSLGTFLHPLYPCLPD